MFDMQPTHHILQYSPALFLQIRFLRINRGTRKWYRYRITKKGISIASDIKSAHNIMQKHLEVMFRIGNMGKFMTMDLIDRISAIGSTLSSNLDRMTEEEKNKYKDFLVNELKKLNNQEKIQVDDRKVDDRTITEP